MLVYVALLFSIVGIIIAILLLLTYWILHNVTMSNIRKNGVRITKQQFPQFHEQAQQLAARMNINMPNIYVIQSGGVLNAFATKFGIKNMVVLYSDVFALIDEGGEDEVLYVLAHEFAHVKRQHVGYSWLLMPGLAMPFLGKAYSRACEFTCDRYAAYYSGTYEQAKRGLLVLAIGPQLYRQVNEEAFVEQIETESGVFAWVEEILSTHPNLPRRIYALNRFFNEPQTRVMQTSKAAPMIAVGAMLAVTALIIGATILGTQKLEELAAQEMDMLLDDSALYEEDSLYEDDMSWADSSEESDLTELMVAVTLQNMDDIERLAADEATLNAQNSEGYTALHLAVIYEDVDTARYLLEQGANIETFDSYQFTPLMEAATNNDEAMVKLLLEHGAKKDTVNEVGLTAAEAARQFDYEHMTALIESY